MMVFLGQVGTDPSELALHLESLAIALEYDPGQADLQQAYDQALARLSLARVLLSDPQLMHT